MNPPAHLLFTLGTVVATPDALAATAPYYGLLHSLLVRYGTGDWGDVSGHDRNANDQAIVSSGQIASVYHTPAGTRLRVTTEADRSSTCVFLPDEY